MCIQILTEDKERYILWIQTKLSGNAMDIRILQGIDMNG